MLCAGAGTTASQILHRGQSRGFLGVREGAQMDQMLEWEAQWERYEGSSST